MIALSTRLLSQRMVWFREDLSMARQSRKKSASQPKKRASKKSRGKTVSATRQTADWITSSLTSLLVREAVAAALIAGAGAAAAVFAGHSGSRAKKKN